MSNDSKIEYKLEKNNATAIFSTDFVKQNLSNRILDDKITSPLTQSKMMLFILGMVERIDFAKTPIVTLGRFDWHLKTDDQLDLSTYGAIERGVSRIHCKLEYIDQQIIVTDLGSANGTYVAGNRLEATQPIILKKGEELTVGRLPIQFIAAR